MKYEMKKLNIQQHIHSTDAAVADQNDHSINSNKYTNKDDQTYNGINFSVVNANVINPADGNEIVHESNAHENHNHESLKDNYKEKDVCEEVLNCTYCNKHVNPIVKKYIPFFVYIIILFLFIFISIFTLFVIPVIFLTFKQKRYICPFCNKHLTSAEKTFTIKKEDKIIIFQWSKCAIIVSVKYLILFFLLIILIFSFYLIRKSTGFNLDFLGKGPLINTTWIDFLEDCGNKSQFRNQFHSINNFKNKYYGNTVIWRGQFHHITVGFFNSNSLFVKMVPSEYRYDRPDIQLFFNNSLISKIENLEKNDFIEFECTLLEISKNKNPHLCLLWDIKLIEKYTQKQFTVIEFFKPLTIFDFINLHSPNPFFISLNEQQNIGNRVEIINVSGNKLHDVSRFPNDEGFTVNVFDHTMSNENGSDEDDGRVNIKLPENSVEETVFIKKRNEFYDNERPYHLGQREGIDDMSHFAHFFSKYDEKEIGGEYEEDEEEEMEEEAEEEDEEEEEKKKYRNTGVNEKEINMQKQGRESKEEERGETKELDESNINSYGSPKETNSSAEVEEANEYNMEVDEEKKDTTPQEKNKK